MTHTTEKVVSNFLTRFIDENDSLENIKWSVEEQKSNGYCSGIFKLTIKDISTSDKTTLKNSHRSQHNLIVKIPYNTNVYKEMQPCGIFDKEIIMYEKILPRMNQLIGSADCFSPRFWGTDGEHTVVLENLSDQGYKSLDPTEIFDPIQLSALLRKMAQFHATSMKLNKDDPIALDKMKSIPFQNFMKENSEAKMLFTKRLVSTITSLAPAENRSQILEKLEKYRDLYISNVLDALDQDQSSFNVLIHGDLWLTNALFKPEKLPVLENFNDIDAVKNAISEKPDNDSVRFIDFQLSIWTNPAIEILYLFITSSTYEIFQKYGDELLEIYIRTLHETLEKLDCQCDYTVADLKSDIKKRFGYGLFLASFNITICRAEDRIKCLDLTNEEFLDSKIYKELAGPWMEYLMTEMTSYVDNLKDI